MIDSRNRLSYQRRRHEWLIRNPVLSQSCPMDPSEAELQVHLRGMEEADRILPNFFQFDQVGSITSPFDAGLIDTDKEQFSGINADVMNNENDFINSSDNAVDPFLYINKSADPTLPQNELSPIAVVSPNVELPNCPQSTATTPTSVFARQQSVNFVMEVLASCPVDNPSSNFPSVSNYPPTPSPQLGDEDFVIEHPSPGFLYHEVQRTRTASEHMPYLPSLDEDHNRSRAFSYDHSLFCRGTDLLGSIPAQSFHTAGNETEASNVNETTANTTSCTDSSISTENEDAPVMESLPSIVKECLQNPPKMHCEDSLDMVGMMQDFIESTKSLQKKAITPPLSPHPVVDLTVEQPCTSEIVPKMKRTASYKRRRDQNNKACRESRKKRKIRQCETEKKVSDLEVENEELKVEISRLEKEVEEVRVLVLQKMSGRPKR